MAKVQRANVILTVKDTEVDSYIIRGFNEIDEVGNIIRETTPTDVATLQSRCNEYKQRIAKLEAEVNRLRSQKTQTQKKTSAKKSN